MSTKTEKQIILDWLRGKLTEAEKSVVARDQAAAVWKNGNNKSWQAAGCSLKKSQRLKISDRECRISIKCRREVEMYKAVIATLEATEPILNKCMD